MHNSTSLSPLIAGRVTENAPNVLPILPFSQWLVDNPQAPECNHNYALLQLETLIATSTR